MSMVLDHPIIRAMERSGEVGRVTEAPVCPVCGMETDTYYRVFGEIVGCDGCVHSVDAWEVCERGRI